MYIDKCHTISVTWDTSEQLWAVTWADSEGHQLGENEWYQLKEDAVDMAQDYYDSDRCHKLNIQRRAA